MVMAVLLAIVAIIVTVASGPRSLAQSKYTDAVS